MFDHRTAITVTPLVGKDVIGHATDIFGEVAHQVASLQDSVVREQLIAAGWTPPEVRKQDEQIIRQLANALEWSSPHVDAAHGWKSREWAEKRSAAIAAARARLKETP